MKLTNEDMLAAMRRNDSDYDGRFYVGVLSTGIYCLPSCRARLPLPRNVRFYATREAALVAGLRACKRCRPDRFPNVLPEWMTAVTDYMRAHPDQRLTEHDLARQAGVDISTIRRYFKRFHQSTPLAFHRSLRLTYARELIEAGKDYLEAAYACGYESASGFRDAFAREFGGPPGKYYVRT